MAGDKLCLHNKFGFCKHGDKCRKEHVQEICQDNECNQSECRRRHPKECKYFKLYKRCKFNDFCAFSHVIPLDPVLEILDLDLFNFSNNVTRIYPKDNYCLIKGHFLRYVEYEKLDKIHQSSFL